MIGRRGERGSGISVLAARHDDDDEQVLPIHVRVDLEVMAMKKFLTLS